MYIECFYWFTVDAVCIGIDQNGPGTQLTTHARHRGKTNQRKSDISPSFTVQDTSVHYGTEVRVLFYVQSDI